MENILSKSEKKRRSKRIENLASELIVLHSREIGRLPCSADLRNEILAAAGLKGGARKRQMKYLAKMIRNEGGEELLEFLEKHKGSQLKQTKAFHELEQLRDSLLNETISLREEAEKGDDEINVAAVLAHNTALHKITAQYPWIDENALQKSLWQFARTRKPAHSREVFRLLKAAQEKDAFNKTRGE